MSGRGRYIRYERNRQQPNETGDEYMDRLIQYSKEDMAYLTNTLLIGIYAIDQNIGQSIHDAYRQAILAVIDGAENVDELIAGIKSKGAVLTTTENLLQSNDELYESFKAEAQKTADSMAMLIRTNTEVGYRLQIASFRVISRTLLSTYDRPEHESDDLDSDDM